MDRENVSAWSANGETWKPIRYPGFRASPNPKAWRYVSDLGRLMTGSRRVVEAPAGRGYFRTTLPVQAKGGYLGSRNVALHQIVAYTFLGPPPGPLHTVDHVDQCAWNNRASNLRWASPATQVQNRVFGRYAFDVRGDVCTSIAQLATRLRVGQGTVAAKVRHAREGQAVEVNGESFTVVAANRTPVRVRSDLSSVTAFGDAPNRRQQQPNRSFAAFRELLHGHAVDRIAETMGLARATVLSYIGKAAREASQDDRERLAHRLGLARADDRRALQEAIVEFHRRPHDNYWDDYRDLVVARVPSLGPDWMLVKMCLGSIVGDRR